MRHIFLITWIITSLFFGACQNQEAIKDPEKFYSKEQEKRDLERLDLAGAEFQNGNYSKAILLFDEIIVENNPGSVYQASYNKAYCYYKLGDFDEVKKTLDFVLTIDTAHAEYSWFRYNTFFMLGRVASKEGNVEDALANFNKALEYQKTADIYNTLALCETRNGMHEQAIEHINLAMMYQRDHSNHFSTRALIYLKLNKLEEATTDVEKSIQLDSLNPYGFKHRAMIHIKQKRMESVCADLYQADSLQYKRYANPLEINEVDSMIVLYCVNGKKKPANSR